MKKIFIIAKWELRASKLKFNKKNAMLLLFLCFSLCLGFKTINLEKNAVSGIYSIQVVNAPVIKNAVISDKRFRITEKRELKFDLLRKGKLDLIIAGHRNFVVIYHSNSKKSEGALDAVEQALNRYKLEALWKVSKDEITKAFPLWVEIHYLLHVDRFQYYGLGKSKSKNKEKEYGKNVEKFNTPLQEEINSIDKDKIDKIGKPEPLDDELIENFENQENAGRQNILPPALLSPPIPFYFTVVAFIFALPLYLFSQFYSQSIMDDKINKKVELLLVSPLSSIELVFGKFVVYFILNMITEILLSFAILKRIDLFVVLALVPVTLIFLAFSFISSVISRSFKENSFIILFFSVALLAYFYFPAMFYNIHAISKISPVTLIVKRIGGEAIKINEYLFATLPLYLCSALVLYAGVVVFKEEYLFNRRGIIEKTLDIIEEFIKKGKREFRLFLSGLFAAVIAYFLELIYLTLVFQIPLPYSIYAMLLLSAITEELLKVAGVIALSRIEPSIHFVYPLLSATGFFIGERVMKIITIAQITNSLFGMVIFKEYFILSLTLHVLCTLLASLPILLRKRKFLPISIIIASILHAAYNYTLVF